MNSIKQTRTQRTSRGWETNDPTGVFNAPYVTLRTMYKLHKLRSIERNYELYANRELCEKERSVTVSVYYPSIC
jgi:hypothetical protein